jgi:putative peptidoglycan lipid II flippase
LTLPAALGLAILATPLIATLLHRDLITAVDVFAIRAALVAYSVGLTGIILIKILAPAYYARQNIKTPVKIAVVTLVVTQLLNLAFVPIFKHAGLALSIGLAACVNAGLLFYFLRKDKLFTPQPEWLTFFIKLAVALYMMGGAIWWLSGNDADWLQMNTISKCIKLGGVIAAGIIVYFASLFVMGFRLRDFAKRTS